LSLAATPIVAVLALGAGAGEIGLLAAVQTLPFLLLAIPLGLVADRVPRRRVMLAAEAVRAASLLVRVAGAAHRAVVDSQPRGPRLPRRGRHRWRSAWRPPALVPALVPREALAARMGGWNWRAAPRSRAARHWPARWSPGPGRRPPSLLAAVLSAAAAVLLLRLREPERPCRPRVIRCANWPMARDWWGHTRCCGRSCSPHWPGTCPGSSAGRVRAYAMRTLGLSASAVGLTLAAYGAGMVTGALLAARLIGAMAFGRAVQFGPATSVVAAAVMVATLWVPSGALAMLSFFLFRLRAHCLDDHLDDAAPDRDAGGDAGAGVGPVPHGQRRRAAAGAALGGFVGAQLGRGGPACGWRWRGSRCRRRSSSARKLHSLRVLPEPAG
jgi:hypothetical protein